MRVASVRAARRKLVKLFRKPKSKFYWYDFTVRGHRYRRSTQEAKSVRALQVASLKLASVMENTDPLPCKAPVLGNFAERLTFPGSAANANCALRTLRRMLHKAEEWKVIAHAPKIKMMKEHGRHLRLDDEAERKLIAGASACKWRSRTKDLFRQIVILMRDTGMRNERELFRMRI